MTALEVKTVSFDDTEGWKVVFKDGSFLELRVDEAMQLEVVATEPGGPAWQLGGDEIYAGVTP